MLEDFKAQDGAGHLFAFVLPAGDYEIFSADLGFAEDTGYALYTSKRPISIPFSVAQGEIVYLGQLLFATKQSADTFFGQHYIMGGYFVMSNHWWRDSRLLKDEYPNMDWSKARMAFQNEETPSRAKTH